MIYETTNPLLIPRLLELAKTLPVPELLPELEKALISAMTSANAKIFVEEKDDEMRGFIFGSIEEFDGQDSCFIQTCVIKPNKEENYIVFELLSRMKLWAKDNNLEYLYFMTPRNYKAFERKYKFNYYATVLRKRINDKKESASEQPIQKQENHA